MAQVVIVLPRRGRIDVLVAADASEAVDHRDDHSPHLPGSDEAIQFRLQVLSQRVDPEEGFPGPGVPDDPIRRGIPLSRIVLRGKIDGHVPTGRILERIPLQLLRIERLDDNLSTRHSSPAGQTTTRH